MVFIQHACSTAGQVPRNRATHEKKIGNHDHSQWAHGWLAMTKLWPSRDKKWLAVTKLWPSRDHNLGATELWFFGFWVVIYFVSELTWALYSWWKILFNRFNFRYYMCQYTQWYILCWIMSAFLTILLFSNIQCQHQTSPGADPGGKYFYFKTFAFSSLCCSLVYNFFCLWMI